MNAPDRHIPDKAPRIGIAPVDTRGEHVRVILKGDPIHFGAFESGDEFVVCDYDLPDETLTQISRGMTRGPVMCEGRRCTEIVSREYLPGGEALQQVRRLVTADARFGHILWISLRRPNGMGNVEITDLEFPIALEPKTRWHVHRRSEPFRDTPESSRIAHTNIERITGVCDVHIGKDHYRCLRWLRPRTTGIGYREAEEIFIDIDSGLTVLIRSFVGAEYPDIERLQRSPKLEVAGEIYSLRYIRRIIRDRPDTGGVPGTI